MHPIVVFCLLACLFITGCSKQNSDLPKEDTFQEITPGSIYKGEIHILEPSADEAITYGNSDVILDASNAKEGYIMVKSASSDAKRKVRITLDKTYTYDLNTDGKWEVYPLQMEKGNYEVEVFENIEGTSYMRLYSQSLSVLDESIERVFLYPSQFVWYTHSNNATKLSYDICDGLESDEEKVKAIFHYLSKYLDYDHEKAKTVQSGYIPNLDEILEAKKGICFDYAGLFAAMCRAQNIPVRLVMGDLTSKNVYHAWNSVLLNGEWKSADVTYNKMDISQDETYIEDRRY